MLVTGRVQGVGFRAATLARARSEDPSLAGFVRNLKDGRVEAVFQGEEGPVLVLVSWCTLGPAHAGVERLEVIEEAPEDGLSAFGVKT